MLPCATPQGVAATPVGRRPFTGVVFTPHVNHGAMTPAEPDPLAERLTAGLRQISEANTLLPIAPQLLRLLARRQPVSPQAIAAATGRSREEIERMLGNARSVELDREGRVVGSGLSLLETPYQFRIGGKNLFTWCALDTLIFPHLLERRAHVESACPVSREPIRVEVTPASVERVEPPTAVVSLVVPTPGEPVRSSFCNHVQFFRSEADAKPWLESHPGAVVVPVERAFALGRTMSERVFGGPAREFDGCC